MLNGSGYTTKKKKAYIVIVVGLHCTRPPQPSGYQTTPKDRMPASPHPIARLLKSQVSTQKFMNKEMPDMTPMNRAPICELPLRGQSKNGNWMKACVRCYPWPGAGLSTPSLNNCVFKRMVDRSSIHWKECVASVMGDEGQQSPAAAHFKRSIAVRIR